MTTQELVINFHGTDLFVVEHNGQPYTPMKTIVEGMGLDWASQFVKLKSNEQRWGIVKITIPTIGSLQEAVCMPLRKLSGWLSSIHPNKVKPELRETIIYYQNECDDVLWEHWQEKSIRNGLVQLPSAPERKTKKALPGCLTLEQQDTIKAMVKARGERVPPEKAAGVIIKTWSSIKSKFGCTYKEIPQEDYLNVVSLIERLPIEGELMPKNEQHAIATTSERGR